MAEELSTQGIETSVEMQQRDARRTGAPDRRDRRRGRCGSDRGRDAGLVRGCGVYSLAASRSVCFTSHATSGARRSEGEVVDRTTSGSATSRDGVRSSRAQHLPGRLLERGPDRRARSPAPASNRVALDPDHEQPLRAAARAPAPARSPARRPKACVDVAGEARRAAARRRVEHGAPPRARRRRTSRPRRSRGARPPTRRAAPSARPRARPPPRRPARARARMRATSTPAASSPRQRVADADHDGRAHSRSTSMRRKCVAQEMQGS